MDQNKFLQAFKDFNEVIYNYIFFNVYRQKELAEDLTQETFMRAWKYRNSYKADKASIKTWLYRIAKNQMIDYFKQNKVDLDLTTEVEDDITSDDQDQVIMKEDLLRALNFLKVEEKSLIIMRYIEELDFEEIAKIIKKNYTATKVALHRAIKNLEHITKYGKQK